MDNIRDVTLINVTEQLQLVVACDSSAAIGEKPLDIVVVPPELTARLTLRVPLLELICVGATPIAVVDTLGNEMEPTGRKVIGALREELKAAGLEKIPVNGSTEDNMMTQTTSVGITVIGEKRSGETSFKGERAFLYQIGDPLVGEQVLRGLNDLISYQVVRELVRAESVIDVIPVGSKGIAYEAEILGRSHKMHLDNEKALFDERFHVSAGPATVLLVLVDSNAVLEFEEQFEMANQIASLRR